jgi:DNA repair exonuclease SbcCD nuclease subunit
MKILIFSDLHYGKHKHVGEKEALDVLDEILSYARKNKLTCWFCGDFFDKGEMLSPSMLKSLSDILYYYKDVQIKMISGQHDAEDFSGRNTAIDVLGDMKNNFVFSFKDTDCFYDGSGAVYYAQHNRDKEKLRRDLKLLSLEYRSENNLFIGHFLVKELLEKDGTADKIPYDVSFEEYLQHLNCDFYFVGDYHRPVQYKNIVSVGTCFPHSFKDKHIKGSFLVYDTESKSIERIYLETSPYFTTKGIDDIQEGENRPVFVKMQVKSDQEKEKIMNEMPLNINMLFEMANEEEEISSRLDMDVDTMPEEVIKKYCEHMGVDEEFIKKGLEYV